METTVDAQELYKSSEEANIRSNFIETFKKCPIPDEDLLQNIGLFISSKNLARILFMHHIYNQIVNVHGVVMEFGCRWGQNLALFAAMRGIYEPFNRMRKIIGFDTFTGFPNIHPTMDNLNCKIMHEGGLACTKNYENYLEEILKYHETDNPMGHVKRFEIVKGDANIEIGKYFVRNPETVVALAFFDFDIYFPTKVCLATIKDRLVKGSIVAFDEINDHDSPGETTALIEVFGLNNIRLQRLPFVSRVSYFVVE